APASAGAAAGDITLLSTAGNSPHVLTLAGNGVAQVLQLNVNPTSVDFGDVTVGSISNQSVMMTNVGNVNLTVTAANVTGTGFGISPPLALPLTLTPGQTSNFTVQFAPAATGAVNGSVSLVSNATNSPTNVMLTANGVPAPVGQLTTNPMSVSFGDVIVGNTDSEMIDLTNTGTASLTITAANVTGAGFSINPPLVLPLTLTPGQTSSFTVQFAPASAGAAAGSVSLVSNASNSPTDVMLAGNGIAQVLLLSANPMSIDYGDVVVGNTSTMSGTLTNVGNTDVTVTAANVTGTGFSLNPPLALPFTLTPGQSTPFSVQFAPLAVGSIMGSVSFVSNATNSPTVVSLQANAIAAPTGMLDLSPMSLDFGDAIVGNMRSMMVTLTNSGAASLDLTAANITGAQFSINPPLTLPQTLAAGQMISFNVQFAPTSAGAVAGSIQFVSTANSPTLTLAGNGIAQVLQLSLSRTSINFGDVVVGNTSSRSVTMTNAGNVDLTVTAANVTGASFSINPPLALPLTLTPGQSSNFTVRFAPAATGAVNGSVSLVSNASNSPTNVMLAGNGVPAPVGQLTANPMSVNFGDVIVGNTSNQTVMLTNNGTASLTITAANVTG
ncbi:MAG TPA: choice-of-anchor D domain-containing protein, partial [Verrucomicrobiae bacterium]|nr:choice-of-anchor D domain-containing protein [Verrucomicrobiae bacterium]